MSILASSYEKTNCASIWAHFLEYCRLMHPTLSRYFQHYSAKEAPFMHQQLAEWGATKPLSGLRVIHHIPLVPNTLLKIACLMAAGAEITVTNPSSFVSPHPEAVACLHECGIRYTEHPASLRGEQFDLYFDCGGELFQALGNPKIGAIELTGSGDQYYRRQQLQFPVISIDRTLTKQLETIFGSAESANVAIAQTTGINPAEKTWMIFGFGKIGRGLAYFCVHHHAPVVIVDPNPQARHAAQQLGIKAIDPQDQEILQQELVKTDIVITATGSKAVLAPYPRGWFDNKILANMGVYDEYGDKFNKDVVLNNKQPVNFMLEDPTPIKYMDPEFYAHNIAALPLLTNQVAPGTHDLAQSIDMQIIKRWCDYHLITPSKIENWFIGYGGQ